MREPVLAPDNGLYVSDRRARQAVAPMPAPVSPQGPLEELLADYCRYLSIGRGLSDHTVFDAYGPAAPSRRSSSPNLGRLTHFIPPASFAALYITNRINPISEIWEAPEQLAGSGKFLFPGS